MKINEIAKKLKLEVKEVVEKAKKLGYDVKTGASNVSEEDGSKIIAKLQEKTSNTEDKNQAKKADNKTQPYIIRREVIFNDDEAKKEEIEKKKKEEKRKDVGFVQKRNTEYNIVYRNKPNKPLTVSELFGLGKKEEKKEEKPEAQKLEVSQPAPKKEEVVVEKEEKPAIEEKKPAQKPQYTNTKEVIGNNSYIKSGNTSSTSFNRNNNNNNYNNHNNNNFHNNNRFNNNNRNQNQQNNKNNYNNYNNGNNQNSFGNRNRFNNGNNNQSSNNGFNRNNNYNNNGGNNFQRRNNQDGRKFEKQLNDVLDTEIMEKENTRDYSSKAIDKQKFNAKFDETKQKRATKQRRNSGEDYDESKLRDLSRVDKLSNMFDDQEGGMLDYYDLSSSRGKKKKKGNKEEGTKQKIFKLTNITIPEEISVKDLSAELKKTSGEVIKKLLDLGIMASINQIIDFDTAFLVAQEFDVTATKKEVVKEEDILFDDSEDKEEDLVSRPPVVVVMGHVDHGKTSLLDAIRNTNVIEGEAGGITQKIGAYKVKIKDREITFLDTPGHEAFTSMRARGAQITDVAILIIAADDGVMPQTVEAINHAKAANIPIIVAINKIDVPGANPGKIRQELMKYDLVPEEWGGDTVFVEISAKQKINIDQLLEMVLLVADMQDLKTNPTKQAKGVVIEAKLDKAKGAVASVLVQRGKLDKGDTIVVGTSIGRIRTMTDDKGNPVKSAGASTPVVITGLTSVPEAGDIFYEVKNEKVAKKLIEKRELQAREEAMNAYNKVTLNNLFDRMAHENVKQLNVIVKADVQGSSEALKQSLEKLSTDEVEVRVIHSSTGAINESDVNLALAAKAIIIGFNIRPTNTAKDIAEKGGVEIKLYSVIYDALEDVELAMNGLLDPVYEEKVIGNVEVRQTFKVSNVGTIAGGYVKDGKVERNAGVRVIRDNVVIHQGKLVSLKRFKDDVKEVGKGFECGLQIEGYNDIAEGDIIEVYVQEEVKRTIKKIGKDPGKIAKEAENNNE